MYISIAIILSSIPMYVYICANATLDSLYDTYLMYLNFYIQIMRTEKDEVVKSGRGCSKEECTTDYKDTEKCEEVDGESVSLQRTPTVPLCHTCTTHYNIYHIQTT